MSGESLGFGPPTSDTNDESLGVSLSALLPSSETILELLKDEFDLGLTDRNTIEIDLNSILEQSLDLSDINITIPSLNISEAFP